MATQAAIVIRRITENIIQLTGGENQLEKGQWGFAVEDQTLAIRDLEGSFHFIETKIAMLDSILVKEPVETVPSLPSGDQTGTLRMVLSENSYWFKTASNWVQMPDVEWIRAEIERVGILQDIDAVTDVEIASDADSVSFIYYFRNLKTGLESQSVVSPPIVSSLTAGFMNPVMFDAFERYGIDIDEIKSMLTGLPRKAVTAGLGANPAQEDLTAAFSAVFSDEAVPGDEVAGVDTGNVWIMGNAEAWMKITQASIGLANGSNPGMAKHSAALGKVGYYAAGVGEVNGWTDLSNAVSAATQNIASLQTAVNGKAPANASLTAETGGGTAITTPAVSSATVQSILQTIWNKIRQVANALSNYLPLSGGTMASGASINWNNIASGLRTMVHGMANNHDAELNFGIAGGKTYIELAAGHESDSKNAVIFATVYENGVAKKRNLLADAYGRSAVSEMLVCDNITASNLPFDAGYLSVKTPGYNGNNSTDTSNILVAAGNSGCPYPSISFRRYNSDTFRHLFMNANDRLAWSSVNGTTGDEFVLKSEISGLKDVEDVYVLPYDNNLESYCEIACSDPDPGTAWYGWEYNAKIYGSNDANENEPTILYLKIERAGTAGGALLGRSFTLNGSGRIEAVVTKQNDNRLRLYIKRYATNNAPYMVVYRPSAASLKFATEPTISPPKLNQSGTNGSLWPYYATKIRAVEAFGGTNEYIRGDGSCVEFPAIPSGNKPTSAPSETTNVLKVNSFLNFTLDLTSGTAASGFHTHTVAI